MGFQMDYEMVYGMDYGKWTNTGLNGLTMVYKWTKWSNNGLTMD